MALSPLTLSNTPPPRARRSFAGSSYFLQSAHRASGATGSASLSYSYSGIEGAAGAGPDRGENPNPHVSPSEVLSLLSSLASKSPHPFLLAHCLKRLINSWHTPQYE